MKQPLTIAFLLVLAALPAGAQVTITSEDMFTQAGLYYRVYSNPASAAVTTGHVMGSAGPNQIWDFSKGPTDVVYQFDIKNAADVDPAIASNFPEAGLVEVKAEVKPDQTMGAPQYLFFSQSPGEGRRVYGPYSDAATAEALSGLGFLGITISPAWVFTPPVIDFPDQISYGQEWSSTTSWMLTSEAPDIGDGTDTVGGGLGGFSFDIEITETSDSKVDAWGTVILPEEFGGKFEQALRVNSEVTDVYSTDVLGTGESSTIATAKYRVYYWLMPGKGIVASLVSEASHNATPESTEAVMPPDDFPKATQFWRMFATNKKTSSGGSSEPQAVTDLRIRVNNGQVLLSWSRASGASRYRLEYSNGVGNPLTWNTLGSFTNQLFVLDTTTVDAQRLYRVVSLK